MVNGIDSTEHRRQNGTGCQLAFPATSGEDFKSGDCYGYNLCRSGWTFNDDKDLRFDGCIIHPQLKTTVLTYHIIKLYKKDLIFEVTHPDNGNHYLFEYTRE